MTRNGKIARLPERIRDEINRRLHDGEKGRQIIAWLNASEAVQAVLAREFGGQAINDTNLSQWKQGGFRDWLTQQTTLDEARRVMAEGGELAQAGNGKLADNLAVWLTGRYIVATRRLIENGGEEEAWKLLREICHDLVALRRGDHGAEWLRIEQAKLKLHRQKAARQQRKERQESEEKEKPLPRMSEEEKERRYAEIFGYDLESHPMYRKRNPFASSPDDVETAALPPEEDGPAPAQTDLSVRSPGEPQAGPPPPEEPEVRELREITKMAERGHAYSAYCLGARYRDGQGVPKDMAKAREWLGKAAARGIGGAKIELRALVMRFGEQEEGQKPDCVAAAGGGELPPAANGL